MLKIKKHLIFSKHAKITIFIFIICNAFLNLVLIDKTEIKKLQKHKFRLHLQQEKAKKKINFCN